jgi:hypothetical protein
MIIEVSITAATLREARDKLEYIAMAIDQGEFSANCTRQQQEEFGGTILVTSSPE